MIAVLEWAQKNGVAMSVVTVGTCHVELQRAPSSATDAPGRSDHERIYQRFGGDMLRHAVANPGERVDDENGLQPVLGRG